jgi:hypothetical protein
MNRMRTTGSRKISDTCDSDAYAPKRAAAVGGTSRLDRKTSNSGDRAVRAQSPIGFPRMAMPWRLSA